MKRYILNGILQTIGLSYIGVFDAVKMIFMEQTVSGLNIESLPDNKLFSISKKYSSGSVIIIFRHIKINKKNIMKIFKFCTAEGEKSKISRPSNSLNFRKKNFALEMRF